MEKCNNIFNKREQFKLNKSEAEREEKEND